MNLIIRSYDCMARARFSVTDAARNFSDCVNRVRYQNTTFVLFRSGLPVAELSPSREQVCSGADLAETLKRVRMSQDGLSPDELSARHDDLQASRHAMSAPPDKWKS